MAGSVGRLHHPEESGSPRSTNTPTELITTGRLPRSGGAGGLPDPSRPGQVAALCRSPGAGRALRPPRACSHLPPALPPHHDFSGPASARAANAATAPLGQPPADAVDGIQCLAAAAPPFHGQQQCPTAGSHGDGTQASGLNRSCSGASNLRLSTPYTSRERVRWAAPRCAKLRWAATHDS